MSDSYAVIENGTVVNVVLWDGEAEWNPDAGEAVKTDGTVSIGWSYKDGVFSAPPVPEPSQKELIASAEQEQASRLDAAKSAIVIWQTKLLMGRKLSDAESTQLNAWMDYIDAVTAVDTSKAPNITWPTAPVDNP